MTVSFTNRSGKMRLYDGAGTPYYLELDFDAGDFSGPLGIPRPEEILKLNRGKSDADAHYIMGSDDKIMEPLELSFSALLTDLAVSGYLADWLRAMSDGGTTTINTNTIATTKEDSQRDGSTNSPPFADSNKFACNIEIKWDGTPDWGLKYMEVYIPLEQCSVGEGDDAVTLSITGFVYGTITELATFTAGTDITV